jgi:hypothetical protein
MPILPLFQNQPMEVEIEPSFLEVLIDKARNFIWDFCNITEPDDSIMPLNSNSNHDSLLSSYLPL